VAPRSFLTSHACELAPARLARRDAAILEAAAYGECHIHAATVAGDVLALGAYHRPPARADARSVWRRRTGGRAVSCGAGFLVVTLGLPHRSFLVGDDRFTLKPEQVMNRCARGLLAWLRRSGVDALYPGLDLLTAGRRALAHVSFAETEPGPTLFQAVVAYTGSLADTARLADRLDPEGRVPVGLMAESGCTSLASLAGLAPGSAASAPDLAALAARLGAAYAETFAGESVEIDPAVTDEMVVDPRPPDDDAPPDGPDAGAGAPEAIATGLLGQVRATARVVDGRVASFSLTGDFVAPAWAIARLRTRLVGGPATTEASNAAVDSVLDGQRGYLLGLLPADLRGLLARAIAA
jgi:hypothetical protein